MESESAGQIPSPTTRIHVGELYPTPGGPSKPPGGPATPSQVPITNCQQILLDYDIALAVICGVCFVFGILYTFFGYRFFKATMFLTGFIFGSLLTYLICLEENLLPLEGKIGVAITTGVLCGLITMLVQYVGLFMTGFHLGFLLAVAVLVVMEQFYHPSTKWISIGVLFGSGLLCALLILYFQRSLTMLGTSVMGAALMAVALDYFVEMFVMVRYLWERIKADPSPAVCWFSWLILGLWPVAVVIGTVTQARVTGKGFDHHEALHTRRGRRRKVNLSRDRERSASYGPAPQTYTPRASAHTPTHATGPSGGGPTTGWAGTLHSKYRHLYQIRRVNGDVITQSYLQNIQHKLSPALQALTVTTEDEGAGPSGGERGRAAS